MKRTTIFLPDDLHDQLRRDAFRAGISMAELFRLRLGRSNTPPSGDRRGRDAILKVAGICRRPILTSGIDESLYGI
ncbi:hypothetical protein SBA6_60008 [Candidatus Sulfopaludibacter sp. SbA6]|nr:hypothetical protein SBA6_60008 [Candidatus Sulfopaludibacter sp. SbA6]